MPIDMTPEEFHAANKTGVWPKERRVPENAFEALTEAIGTPMRRVETIHAPKERTKVEARMLAELQHELATGKILWFAEQSINLRLADRTYYKPDFAVMRLDWRVEFRETKGSWKMPHQDDARVKLKVAAETYKQFIFSAWVPQKGGGWKTEWWNR